MELCGLFGVLKLFPRVGKELLELRQDPAEHQLHPEIARVSRGMGDFKYRDEFLKSAGN